MSEETGTATAAQRFGVVMSWIQAIAIIVGLSVSLLLFVIAGYEEWEDHQEVNIRTYTIGDEQTILVELVDRKTNLQAFDLYSDREKLDI